MNCLNLRTFNTQSDRLVQRNQFKHNNFGTTAVLKQVDCSKRVNCLTLKLVFRVKVAFNENQIVNT